jgi:hypothetical protein
MKNPWESLVAALDPESMQSDLGQLGAEVSAFGGQNLNFRPADGRLEGTGISKGENSTRRHQFAPWKCGRSSQRVGRVLKLNRLDLVPGR